MDALPYIETPLPVLLPLSAFLLALHIVAWPIDRLVSCGLLGQMLVGTIWGPVTSWLDLDIQLAVVNLGYVGLILLVYEGNTHFDPF
jgi:Kef-type K+ transport system membrane component KefB